MKKVVGVIGYPVRHSISPSIQQAAFDALQIPAHYEHWETTPGDLANRIASLRQENCLGAQVTIPHKRNVMDMVDEVHTSAQDVGACNMIHNDKGVLRAYNFDAAGFLHGLWKVGFQTRGKQALILGAGGAAQAVVAGLRADGMKRITIAHRSLVSKELCRLATRLSGKLETWTADPDDPQSMTILKKVIQEAPPDLIVNTTPLGMEGSGKENISFFTVDMIPSHALVYDLVYRPAETPLLKAAKKAGAKTQGGLDMLVSLGARCFQVWTKRNAPFGLMMVAAQKALGQV